MVIPPSSAFGRKTRGKLMLVNDNLSCIVRKCWGDPASLFPRPRPFCQNKTSKPSMLEMQRQNVCGGFQQQSSVVLRPFENHGPSNSSCHALSEHTVGFQNWYFFLLHHFDCHTQDIQSPNALSERGPLFFFWGGGPVLVFLPPTPL